MDAINTIIRFLQDGGVFMYPIMLVFAAGLAIAIERYIFLNKTKNGSSQVWDEILPLINEGQLHRVKEIATESKEAICVVVNYGLDRVSSAKSREDVELAVEEGLMDVMPKLEKRTHYIATLANISTLIGLLGTIIGLIQAFTAVSNANPADKADLLSSSISVAMNTTAFGLMSAIPLLIVYAVLQSKTTEVVDSMEMASVKFLNAVSDQLK